MQSYRAANRGTWICRFQDLDEIYTLCKKSTGRGYPGTAGSGRRGCVWIGEWVDLIPLPDRIRPGAEEAGDAGVGEVGAVALGHASARGSTSSKERRAAELLDTVARRGDDGERDYSDGAAAVASAMVRESEEEELGANGCVHRAARGGSRATGSCMARAGVAVEHLPACLAKASSSLERLLGWAG